MYCARQARNPGNPDCTRAIVSRFGSFRMLRPHEFTDDLRGRSVLRAADLQKLLAQIALNSDAKT